MPPQVSVVAVLRWAKENVSNSRLTWLAQILPLTEFTHICQNIYFSVDGYSDTDYILANGYLSYIFFENLVVSEQPNFAEYSQLCRENLETALAKLPVLTPSSMNVIAALTLGAYNAVENSQANAAWAFISAAASHCLMLGYNRIRTHSDDAESLTTAEERLFWAVYRLEKGISLRLGRPSCLRSRDILLPPIPHDIRIKMANIQGRAYDELYSPGSLMRDDFERNCIAKSLAAELRQCIVGTHADIMRVFGSKGETPTDPFGKVYLQFDCSGGVSDECLTVAREALQIHEQCIATVRGCQHEPLMLARYVNWAIVHCPFPPFSILITYVIHSADESELCNLERFAASLEPLGSSVASDLAQPSHLYRLLCKATRLYIRFDTTLPTSETLEFNTSGFSGSSLLDIGWSSSIPGQLQQDPEWLGEWWNGNQLVMGVLDQNTYS
ncbi:hypothetical protein GRF29_19g2086471 [Pseudopithomyces chartarum]|uniref:Xylanolytic transcriptional activator regulatory domain-containing protein n=1 Tax=Pseudopithomyces chartarum TaxID=1892770 RepID=A0AAN6RKI9_9PLEO|nr:hypothetical protein GRF29_19g2086471 [Pseudopithomyces chartarum]